MNFFDLLSFIWQHRHQNILHCNECKKRECLTFANSSIVFCPGQICPYLHKKQNKIFFVDGLNPLYRKAEIDAHWKYMDWEIEEQIGLTLQWLFRRDRNPIFKIKEAPK